MQAISIAHGVQGAAHDKLRLGVIASYARHQRTTGALAENIRHGETEQESRNQPQGGR